jgi:hypothetical protein
MSEASARLQSGNTFGLGLETAVARPAEDYAAKGRNFCAALSV